MASDKPLAHKVEKEIDAYKELWTRRPWICVGIAIFYLMPWIIAAYQHWSTLPDLKSKLEAAEKAKDKAEIRLAPFLAIANHNFPDSPPDKRLELLITRLDKAVTEVQIAAQKVSPERILPMDKVNILVEQLKSIPALDVQIDYTFGDAEGFALASQIKELFSTAGWKVIEFRQAIFKNPIKRLRMYYGKIPSPESMRSLDAIFIMLGYKPERGLDQKLGANSLRIVVGSK